MFVQAFRKLSASAMDDKHIIMQRIVHVTQKPRVSNSRSFIALIDNYGGCYVWKMAKPLQLHRLNSGYNNISLCSCNYLGEVQNVCNSPKMHKPVSPHTKPLILDWSSSGQ